MRTGKSAPSRLGLGVLVAAAWIPLVVAAAMASGPGAAESPAPAGLLLWETATGAEAASSPDLLARGAILYRTRCAACHGLGGAGDGHASPFLPTPPRDFTRGVYKFRTTSQDGMPADMDLFRSITAGFPAYGMPSFRYLSVEDRWALVHFVKGLYPQWKMFDEPVVIPVGDEPEADAGSLERGKDLYERKYNCLECHGESGHGDGKRATELVDMWDRPISPRDFTLGRAFRKGGWRNADMVRILATGISGTPMPSQIDQLADPREMTEFWDIARYVEHLVDEAEKARQ